VQQVAAYRMGDGGARQAGRIVVALAQIEQVVFAAVAEKRHVPDQRPFRTEMQSLTGAHVWPVEVRKVCGFLRLAGGILCRGRRACETQGCIRCERLPQKAASRYSCVPG